MTTAAPRRRSPADLDRELQDLVDRELGKPGTRAGRAEQAERDRLTVQAIGYVLRNPDWGTELLDAIVQIIRDTGREVTGPPLEVLRD